MFRRKLPQLSSQFLSTVSRKHSKVTSLPSLGCGHVLAPQEAYHSGCASMVRGTYSFYPVQVLNRRSYSTKDAHGDMNTQWPENSLHDSSVQPVDVDKELLRYNIEEFYPAQEEDEDDIEDFGETKTSDKVIDVDRELGRYNIDEFYGIELEEQHIKPIPEEEQLRQLPFEMKRGVGGVFDVGEMADFLRAENMWDICVIEVPEHYNYVGHLVLASGSSKRHLKAVAKRVKSVWKKKRGPRDWASIYIEGLKEKSEDWFAVDLGNMALHLMEEETRVKYDIETLWTCGPEFDSQQRIEQLDQLLLPSPSELSADADPDDLFVELARTFSMKHQQAPGLGNVFKFGTGQINWDSDKKSHNMVSEQVSENGDLSDLDELSDNGDLSDLDELSDNGDLSDLDELSDETYIESNVNNRSESCEEKPSSGGSFKQNSLPFNSGVTLEQGHTTPEQDNNTQFGCALDADDTSQRGPVTLKQDSDILKQDSDTLKQDTDTIKQDSDTLKQDSDTLKQDSDTLKQDSDTLKQDSDTLKQDTDTIKQDTDTLKQNPAISEQEHVKRDEGFEFYMFGPKSMRKETEIPLNLNTKHIKSDAADCGQEDSENNTRTGIKSSDYKPRPRQPSRAIPKKKVQK